MKLEQTSLVIRERSQVEVLDITFLFIKQNAVKLLRLFLVLGVPYAAAMTWIGHLYALRGVVPAAFVLAFLPQFILTPSFGSALFRSAPVSLRHHGFRLACIKSCIIDTLLLASVVGLLIRAACRYFSLEVFQLECISNRAAAQRMRAIHQQSYIGAMLRNGLIGTLIGFSVYLSCVTFHGLIFGEFVVETAPYFLAEQFTFWFSVSVGMFYCYTAHFLLYINHRTNYEGWDLYLQARRCVREAELP
jgi:hypothetical protein